MTRHYAIVEAPSVLGLKPTGVERLPDALLDTGLADRIGARRAGRVEPPPYDPHRDDVTRMLNPRAIAAFSSALADVVGGVVDAREFAVVLGGDCTIILGEMLALRRRGRYGLLFVDGHADFYQPSANINGEAASSDLAFVTGRGPSVLTRFDGLSPLVRDEDVVVLGFRDEEEQRQYGSQPLPPAIRAIDLAELRRMGAASAARAAVAHIARHDDVAGFWVHVDADVLDDDLMPAVDYRQPDGLSFDELADVLGVALAHDKAVGVDVTIYNPALDPKGSAGRALAEVLARSLLAPATTRSAGA